VDRTRLRGGGQGVVADSGPVVPVLHQEFRPQGLGHADRGCSVNTADLAILAVTVLGLANVLKDYRVQMRVADRLRIVSPPAAPKADGQDKADEKPPRAAS
jgi:hypothetical protein